MARFQDVGLQVKIHILERGSKFIPDLLAQVRVLLTATINEKHWKGRPNSKEASSEGDREIQLRNIYETPNFRHHKGQESDKRNRKQKGGMLETKRAEACSLAGINITAQPW